ncbi:HlyD family efflux transporter periplasmic adaptor subunit [Pseudoflavonifractor phocaeensis]|uniref:efflux RND transporter periplasmic adaptor subunit n=1 Tax=Pseudoflavonifractor phocaeensis TaxID=1870988 RepID=UPI00313DE1CB
MSEQQTPVVEQAAAPQSPSTPPKKEKTPATHEQKQKKRKLIRRIIALVVALAIIITSAVLLKKFVFNDKEELGEVMTMPVTLGSIQSMVEGTGNARAKNSATVTPDAGYKVLELFVKEGDTVEEGQLLYNLDDSAAQEAVSTAQNNVRKAQETVDDYNTELSKLYDNVADLTIKAPHDGKLIDINADIKNGKDMSVGDAVATVVNDTKLRLHLYYSWAYEGQISVGQTAQITLPASMTSVTGTVEQVNYVKRVVSEGGVTFEVVFVLNNPGTLTEGMTASAALTTSDGTPIYPYESGKLEYFETTKLTVKVAGPVQSVNLMNYADVTNGQVLVQLGDKDASASIASKQNSLREAQKSVDDAVKALEEAQKKLENYHATAPISGRVLSCNLVSGEDVASGQAIQIADTSTMIVDINIDERNVGYVSNGMMVNLQDQMGNFYMGIIEQIALTAKAENGVASFPATVVVDNPEGMLMTGTYIQYSFVASQSDNCLVVPIQAVMNVTLPQTAMPGSEMGEDGMEPGIDDGGMVDGDMGVAEPAVDAPAAGGPRAQSLGMVVMSGGSFAVDGGSMGGSFGGKSDTATVCFVQGEPDERAIEADPSWNMPEGFFAVVVTTGLSDETNVEITSGLNEGDMVFTGYMTNSANTYG